MEAVMNQMESFLKRNGLGGMIGRYNEILKSLVANREADLRAGLAVPPLIVIPGLAWNQLQTEMADGG
jgi:hypothetical protein